MKARLLALAAAGMLASCDGMLDKSAGAGAPQVGAVTAASNSAQLCTTPVRREIAFTAPDAKDVLEIIAVGTDCKQSSVLATIRAASGELIWSRAESTQLMMVFAGVDQSSETPEHALQEQMKGWAESVEVKTSADAPDWKDGDPRPSEPSGLFIGTEFPREQYLSAKTEKRAMLCHMIYMLRTQCLIYFPGDGGAPGYATQLYDLQS
jgi:hypothetical protein